MLDNLSTGKLENLAHVEGELELTQNFKDHMYRCLACLACQDICPVGIKPAELCLDARYAIEQATPTPPRLSCAAPSASSTGSRAGV